MALVLQGYLGMSDSDTENPAADPRLEHGTRVAQGARGASGQVGEGRIELEGRRPGVVADDARGGGTTRGSAATRHRARVLFG